MARRDPACSFDLSAPACRLLAPLGSRRRLERWLDLDERATRHGDPAGTDLLLALPHRTTRQSVTTCKKMDRTSSGA